MDLQELFRPTTGLALLAASIVEAILEGRVNQALVLERLLRQGGGSATSSWPVSRPVVEELQVVGFNVMALVAVIRVA